MTISELIVEGEALARPSFLLRAAPPESGVVGYWKGACRNCRNESPGANLVERSHIVSISEELLSRLGIHRGPISLFKVKVPTGNTSYRVESDPRLRFAEISCGGESLYASPSSSFPPFPAVCLYGSDRVAAWLKSLGLARHDYWRVPGELSQQYEAEWISRSPFYQQTADVVVGGWHFLWPDDDFFVPPELRLVALTLRDAEPWFELWFSPMSSGWTVKTRET